MKSPSNVAHLSSIFDRQITNPDFEDHQECQIITNEREYGKGRASVIGMSQATRVASTVIGRADIVQN